MSNQLLGMSGPMLDKEKIEKAGPQMQPMRKTWRYRPGESRLFNSAEEVPIGEGWSDLRSAYYAAPAAEPAIAISASEAVQEPEAQTSISEAPKRRGRRPKDRAPE
jgi:hypothetical protein